MLRLPSKNTLYALLIPALLYAGCGKHENKSKQAIFTDTVNNHFFRPETLSQVGSDDTTIVEVVNPEFSIVDKTTCSDTQGIYNTNPIDITVTRTDNQSSLEDANAECMTIYSDGEVEFSNATKNTQYAVQLRKRNFEKLNSLLQSTKIFGTSLEYIVDKNESASSGDQVAVEFKTIDKDSTKTTYAGWTEGSTLCTRWEEIAREIYKIRKIAEDVHKQNSKSTEQQTIKEIIKKQKDIIKKYNQK